MRIVVLALVLSACGRVGFDASVDRDALEGDAVPSEASTATCGDGICAGNDGESCLSCGADCNTTMPVCGNQLCDAGETGDTCFDDCGPVAWPGAWSQLEDDIVAMINAQRASGACGHPATTPLTMLDGLRAVARQQSWDAAHHEYDQDRNGTRCNGVGILQLMGMAGYPSRRIAMSHFGGGTTAGDAVSFWLGFQQACDAFMDPQYNRIGVGHVEEMTDSGVLVWNWALYWRE